MLAYMYCAMFISLKEGDGQGHYGDCAREQVRPNTGKSYHFLIYRQITLVAMLTCSAVSKIFGRLIALLLASAVRSIRKTRQARPDLRSRGNYRLEAPMTQVPGTHIHDDAVRTEPSSSVCPVIEIVLGVRRPPSTGLCPVALSSPSERFSAK
jgi:hypothetical protein